MSFNGSCTLLLGDDSVGSHSIADGDSDDDDCPSTQCRGKSCCGRSTPGKRALAVLLLFQILDRTAFYSIQNNINVYLILFLNFSAYSAARTTIAYTGSVYIFAPLFGWLADRKLGCYRVLVGAYLLSFVGATLTAYSAAKTVPSDRSDVEHAAGIAALATCIAGLVLVSLGESAVRATLIPYMYEQLGSGGERKATVSSFCTISYFCINVGATASAVFGGVLSFVRRPWQPPNDDDCDFNFFWKNCVGVVATFTALVTLITGRKVLGVVPAERCCVPNASLPTLVSVLRTGCSRRHLRCRDALPPSSSSSSTSLISYEQKRNEIRDRLAALVPVLLCMVIYFTIDTQSTMSYQEQSYRMNLHIQTIGNETMTSSSTINCTKSNSYRVKSMQPPMAVIFFQSVTILVCIPVYRWVIRPLWERVFRREITMLDRILAGLVIAIAASLSATAVEVARVHTKSFQYRCLRIGYSTALYIFSALSFFFQFPQYGLLGISEVFAVVATIEFVLSRAPAQLRCTAYGAFNMLYGIGSYAGALLTYVMYVAGFYFEDDPTKRSMDDEMSSKAYGFFVLLDVLIFVNAIVFVWVKRRKANVIQQTQSTQYLSCD